MLESSVMYFTSLGLAIVLLYLLLMVAVGKYLLGWSKRCSSTNRLDGKTVIVTGGSAGIGKATALDLASRGARTIIASRNKWKGEQAVQEIIDLTGNHDVSYMQLDLSDLDSVREFAVRVCQTEQRLDILINNAGVSVAEGTGDQGTQRTTKQGYDYVFGTNYLGHFLLTYLLIDLLKKSAPSRIINVSSVLHLSAFLPVDIDSLDQEKWGQFSPYFSGYRCSKLANVMHAVALSEYLAGSGVTANSLNPGLVNSDIWFPFFRTTWRVLSWLMKLYIRLVAMDEEQAAQTSIFLAVDDSVKNVSGKYFDRSSQLRAHWMSQNWEMCLKLWQISLQMCGIQPQEHPQRQDSLFSTSRNGLQTRSMKT